MKMASAASRWRSPAVWGNIASLACLLAIAIALLGLQEGDWWLATPARARWFSAAATLFLYAGFCWAILRRRDARVSTQDTPVQAGIPVMVVHASQTGFAQQLAERTVENLRSAGLHATLRAIDQVDLALLHASERVLFIASTTGEGDPPDPAVGFTRQVMAQPVLLDHLQYAVLALGDREYEDFCAFGHQLDAWLRRHGAVPLFDLVEVDNADESALRHWQHHLGQLGGITDLPDWTPPRYQQWTLVERRELNPGTAGGGAFHLSLRAPEDGTSPQWLAGDIAEIGPRHPDTAVQALLLHAGVDGNVQVDTGEASTTLSALLGASHLPGVEELQGAPQAIADALQPLPHREYSIGSLPSDGELHLLVRRMSRPDGSPGLGSGWLCGHAAIGGKIALRLRGNRNFHAPDPARPMILIGNGTGIAGLRAHLRQRVILESRRNWLLFGERNADRDFFYGDEILHWQEQGFLERLDLAFSRDQPEPRYVQHALREAGDDLLAWVGTGAAIYVCGSLSGMAPGVDRVLRDVLGDGKVEVMLAEGLYRRDVY